MIATKKFLSVLFTGALAATAAATDYYVGGENASDDNNGTDAPFATIDKAVITATSSDDVIHVAAGTYQTGYPDYVAQTSEAKWGPNLKAKLIGEGTTRADVVLESHGEYRTLRMAADSWLENVTIVGCTDISKTDKGGAIEMSGGTVTNCVIRDGKAYASSNQAGGNLYMDSDAALVVDCLISGGVGKSHGGNVCLIKGTIRASTITKGTTYNEGEKYGANIYMSGGRVDTCTISEGDGYEGGEIYQTGGMVTNCTILANGVTRGSGGGIYMTGGTVDDCYIDGEGGTMSWHGGCIYMKNGTVKNTVCTNGVCTAAGSREGGNIYMENGTLENVTLADGQCAQDGGNLRMTGGTATKLTCIGGAARRSGGNICASNGATIGDSTLSGGTAVSVGGNLYVYGSVTVSDCVISNGVSNADGGNVKIGDSVVVRDCTISGGTVITDAEKKGANVYMDGSAKLIRCHVSGGTSFKADGETAGYDRGSVCANSSTAVIQDCLVEGSSCGGILYGYAAKTYGATIVDNNKYGVWCWGGGGQWFQNCVIFGNYNGDKSTPREWAGDQPKSADRFLNCAMAEGTLSTSTYPTLVTISSADFVDYANGNYRPAAEGKLVDAGAMDSRTDASTLDLDMKPRQSGTIDIGCYEYQKSEMTVNFAYAEQLDHAYAPATAVFSVSANNVPDGQTASFSIDFGDGLEPVVTAGPTVSHTFENPGVYTIVVTASAPGSADAEMTYSNFVTLKSQTVYVTAGNTSPAAPYSTVETGFATVADAYNDAVDGMTIIVGNGVYEQTAKIAVSKAVSIVGNAANPGAVVLKNTATASSGQGDKRVMSIDNAAATVCGLTLEGGQVYHGNGGNLAISAGMISNCVIRGGIALADTDAQYGMGAGVALSGSGIVSHCIITNNEVQGAASGKWAQGSAVVFPWGSSGKMLNCLVAYNRWTVENAEAKGAAGVVYHGDTAGSRVENCTVVANAIVGTCNAASAAGIRCDWNSSVRNTVISGNRIGETVSNVLLARDGEIWKDSLNACVTEDALPSGNASCIVAALGDTFKNYARGDFRPKTGGALANKGSAVQFPVSVDLAGNPRVKFGVIDIGCYEAQTKPGLAVILR